MTTTKKTVLSDVASSNGWDYLWSCRRQSWEG
jgi:hypothetical protein